MATLPSPGGSSGTWGDELNEWLLVGHDEDGNNTNLSIQESLQTGSYTLTAADNSKRIVATAAITITVPSLGTLGDGFECEIVNDSGGTVIVDGPGSSNVTMADGEIVSLLEVNGKQRVAKGVTTVIS